jgi:phosphoribosylformylglycinamidine synthase
MAFAGGLGARVFLGQVLVEGARKDGTALHETVVRLFSESNTRFLCEVRPEQTEAFEAALAGVPCALVGEVVETGRLEIVGLPSSPTGGAPEAVDEATAPLVVNVDLATMKEAWQKPLRW